MALIEFEHVSKTFSHTGGAKLLRSHVEGHLRRRGAKHEVFYALKDVSFEVDHGDCMAIVGGNGAGKSTLLSLVTGLCQPTEGRIQVNGRVAALLELGSGFNNDLTGAENILLNASLLGLSRKKTEAVFDEIVDFSGVGDFINEPLRTYSSGMTMRLAFSVAVHVDPDILIIDEVLAVGDQAFQTKCFERIAKFKREGKTMLFVSHSAPLVRQFCDRTLWLDHGEAVLVGTPDEVLNAYAGKST
jgi:ABC-type polysaccharide/polyol phosphate transport system ATPase subunit